MTCAELSGLLARHVASSGGDPASLSDEAVVHIASCPHCLEELAVAATLVAGRPSTLLHDVFERHACDLVEALLPEWVQARLDGESPAARNPAAWQHAQSCEKCGTAFVELREMVAEADAGAYGPTPWDDSRANAPTSRERQQTAQPLILPLAQGSARGQGNGED